MKKDNFYKTQIEGLSDVEATVRVIEKSAASHIHFLKKKVGALSEYKNQIQIKLGRLSRFYWDNNHPLLRERTAGKSALLVISGEKGIVGGLYHELINEVIIKNEDYEYIWVIGNKGAEYLREEGLQVEEITQFNFDNLPHSKKINSVRNSEGSQRALLKKGFLTRSEISNGVNKMAAYFFQRFQDTGLKKIDVLYTNFISLAEQSPTVTKFLPFGFAPTATKEKTAKLNKSTDGLPIFEPSKKLIFDELLKKYIDVSFVEIILEAKLSEFAARTVTAESAVKETEQLINTFNRKFLKAKHLTITQKQVESFSVHQLTRI